MRSEDVSIRRFRPGDLDDLYRICLRTADTGGDATSLFGDPMLPGHIYAAPYALFEPSLTFVAVDPEGVRGYVVGALDSTGFEARLERRWWPGLRARYPDPPAGLAAPDWTRDQQMAHLIHHRPPAAGELAAGYPSHLHINLLPPLQGRGVGRRLIGTLTETLREQGSPGVHLHAAAANERAVRFYARVGFTEVASTDPAVCIFVMDLRNEPPAAGTELRADAG